MPAITNPSEHFDVVLDTGANIKSACEAVFGDGLYVIKDRANSNNWQWIDYVRGTSAVLQSNTTAAETTYSTPSGNSVGCCWKANGSGVTNTAGSITSTVSANQTAGFSIVTYTGNGGSNQSIGHGLNQAPDFITTKNRDRNGYGWLTGHSSLGFNSKYLVLNTTAAASTNNAEWGSEPTSSVFYVSTDTFGNYNGDQYVAYCFSEIAGYSKFGSYTGNGSADGPFVWTGFRPAFVMIKRTDSSGDDWHIIDNARDDYNVNTHRLKANLSDAESSSDTSMDFLSNGFKHRSTSGARNASGGTYIFAAFSEMPFGGSNTAPANAR